jgi:SAM-dependent methyltransferase
MPAMDYSRVAGFYDLYANTDIDVAFFLQEARGCQSVLELMCGTGRLSIPLIEAGVRLSCLDGSAEMLDRLKEKLQARGISISIFEMDASDFSLPERYDLIIIPFNSFAEITDPLDQESCLRAIHAHLTEGGRFICTLHNPAIRLEGVDGQMRHRGIFPLPDVGGHLALATLENYDPANRLVKGAQIYELYDADGVLQSKWSVQLTFSLHAKDDFEGLLRSQGFVIEALYGDYSPAEFDPQRSPFMIWLLAKV